MATSDQKLWTMEDLCEHLGVTRQTVYAWRHRGEGPPAFRVGRHLRFDPDDIREWLQERRDQHPAA